MKRRLLVGLALGFAAAIIALLSGRLELVDRFENNTYDLRVRQTATPVGLDSPVVVVLIDETSIQKLEPEVGRWPWPRVIHAYALDYLKRAGAKAVGYDILFAEQQTRTEFEIEGQKWLGTESDQALVTSTEQSGNVVLMADAVYLGAATPEDAATLSAPNLPGPRYDPGDGFLSRPRLTMPFPDLSLVSAAVGHTLLVKESDGSARRVLPFIDRGGAKVPLLGLSTVLTGQHTPPDDVKLEGDWLRAGSARLPVLSTPAPPDDSGRRLPSRQVLLRFPRPSVIVRTEPHFFPTYSFVDLVASELLSRKGEPPTVPLDAFKDKYVFVGTSATGTYDSYQTPFGEGATVLGVELHATLASNLLANVTMRRASSVVDIALTLAIGLVVGAMATTLPVAWAVAATLALGVAVGSWLTHAVGQGLWVAAAMPLVAAAVALFEGVSWRYFVEDREKRHVRHLFGRYVSNDVIAQLMADPKRANLGGQRREMTVLFSDIRNFTTASEKGTPEDVVVQLNEYFGAMVDVLFRHQGTLDKFVGDMVMGLFGAPLDDPHHADHAVACALEMMDDLQRLNRKWQAEGKQVVDIGIGVNTGDMIAGNIGSESIMSYTVIGDAVNLGSRLESLNKEHGTHILISEATRSRLTISVKTRPVGDIKVKGKTQAVLVHEVLWTAGVEGPASAGPATGGGLKPAPPTA